MGLKLKKSDQVVVLAGKSKGKKGKVLRLSKDGKRAYIEGVNLMQRRLRPTRQNPKGGFIQQEGSIHLSNIALLDPKSGKPTRFRNKVYEDGSKVRVASKSGQELNN